MRRFPVRWVMACCLAAFALTSVGCASDNRTYVWSSYQHDFYESVPRHVKDDPQKLSKRLEATLKRIIAKSDAAKRKVPPGLLAEYGYFFFQRGEMDSAVTWFEREAREWPESAALMQRMVAQARAGSGS